MVILTRYLHLANSSQRHSWMELLLKKHATTGLKVTFVSIEKQGPAQLYFKKEGIDSDILRKQSLVGLFRFLLEQKMSNDDCLIISHGLMPSIIGLAAKILFKIPYGIVHHHQPNYFSAKENPQNVLRKSVWDSIYLQTLRKSLFVHSLSSEVSRKLTSIKYPLNQTLNLGHGINFESFLSQLNYSEEFCEHGDGISILMIGRLSWEKNYNLAIDTLEELRRREISCSLCIVGVGPDQNDLSRYVSERGLEAQVKFLGWRDDIPNLMNHHKMFLHTALTESYGQVLVEAKLSGMRFVSTNVGIASELSILCSQTKISHDFNKVNLANIIEEVSMDKDTGLLHPKSNELILWAENVTHVTETMAMFLSSEVEDLIQHKRKIC